MQQQGAARVDPESLEQPPRRRGAAAAAAAELEAGHELRAEPSIQHVLLPPAAAPPAVIATVPVATGAPPPVGCEACVASCCLCCCGQTLVPADTDDEGMARYDSVNAGSKRSLYLRDAGYRANLWYYLRENHAMIAICAASPMNTYTRQEHLWVFLVVTMVGVLPAKLIVDAGWKLMAREDLTISARRFLIALLWILLQVLTLAMFTGFEKLAKAKTHVYCARCTLVPIFVLAFVIFAGTLFDSSFMQCASVWSNYDPTTVGSSAQFYGESGLEISLVECQSMCGSGCGGVMHYERDTHSSSRLVPGCKLCKFAVPPNTTVNSSIQYEPLCRTTEKVNPGCPTDGFVLYSRVDSHSFLDVHNVRAAAATPRDHVELCC
jgi:hypothetical protein